MKTFTERVYVAWHLNFVQFLQVGGYVVHAKIDGGQRDVSLQRHTQQPNIIILGWCKKRVRGFARSSVGEVLYRRYDEANQ